MKEGVELVLPPFSRGAFTPLKTLYFEEKEEPTKGFLRIPILCVDASVSASFLVEYAGSEERGAIGSEERSNGLWRKICA